MEKFKSIIVAVILALGLVALGYAIKGGIDNFTNKDRKVTVKGLSEKEVPANRVTWSISVYETGNELSSLYDRMTASAKKVTDWLVQKGIAESEIAVNAPDLDDRVSNRYSNEYIPFNYKLTTYISVTSGNVDLVKRIVNEQGELIRKGIALGGYNPVEYDYTAFQEMKPKMMDEAISNAKITAEQFAKNCGSKLGKIVTADQGQFSVYSKDDNPSIIKLRVVSTITYSLKN